MKTDYPLVSVCTPTYNRRPFIPIMFECFRNQDYPKNRIEWIIVDDGSDKIEDLVLTSDIQQIRYFKIDKKLSLGAKRPNNIQITTPATINAAILIFFLFMFLLLSK